MASEPNADDAALAELLRRRAQEQRTATSAAKPASVFVEQRLVRLMADVEAAVKPHLQIKKLAAYVKDRVRCPGMHQIECNRAAEYVIEDGLPMSVLIDLLALVDRYDAAGKFAKYKDGVGGGRGAFFVGCLKRRLIDRSIPQRKKGVKRT
jgi:hypothetical protein